MPITLKLMLPAGRYHATPWGRHVNEGVPEWPPSPWRLLRALVAVWRRTCADLPEDQVRRALEQLLPPPRFRLPAHREAHTRHFMPWEKKGPNDPTLVFDTFIAVDRDEPLYVGWPDADPTAEQRETLGMLVKNLTSLGRAEAWVHAELTGEAVEWNCAEATPADPSRTRVLCADPESAFDDEHYPTHDPKKLKKGLGPGGLLFDCPRWHLCLDTQTIHDRRWSRVPGSLWVDYSPPPATPTNFFQAAGRRRPPATFARYALDGPVLPLVTETLPLAERVRRGLLEKCKSLENPADARLALSSLPAMAPAFWGKDENRKPLTGHQHAFFLPVDEDDDGRIDHVAVFAPMGFSPRETQAIDRLRRLRLGDLDLSLALVGMGRSADFARSRLLGPSTTWESATPFLVTRHLKRRGRKRDPREWSDGPRGLAAFVLKVLQEEIDRRDAHGKGGLSGAVIEPLIDGSTGPLHFQPHAFHLSRDKSGDDGARRPRGAFRLRFPSPVPGPISLGQACHFGLGLFLQPTQHG